MTNRLIQETTAGVCTLTLNATESRNALSDAMMADLQDALKSCQSDQSVKVVVLAANGSVFCAGHHLRELLAKQGLADYQQLFNRCAELMMSIVHLPKPVIAQVQGTATAAGCQLVASCDLAVAANEARFATPGVHIGLFCSTPMVALSRKVGAGQAMKMLLTGNPISALEAYQYGLVNQVVAKEDLSSVTMDLAYQIASKSSQTLAIGKEAFYRQLEMPLVSAYEYTAGVMADNMMQHDAKEGVSAFIDKRPPQWTGA